MVFPCLPFHRKFIQSVNIFSGVNSHMQLQFRNFPELFVYTVTVPFSRWIIFIYRSSVYRHLPALPPAPLSSLVPLCAMLWLFRSKGAERAKSLEKTAFLGAERSKSLEKQHFWVQSELNPWKQQHFWVQSKQNPWKKQLFLGAERTESLETAFLGAEGTKSLG